MEQGTAQGTGPDLVIAGAARSGTTTLAAALATHPQLDSGSLKEPNFFSREYHRGEGWYNGLFGPRASGVVRLDASTSYTYPQFPEALARLARGNPAALVVYVVRDPIARAVSHYLYYRHYFKREPSPTFGEAMARTAYYVEVSDYGRWLEALARFFPEDQLLLVPFGAVAKARQEVTSFVGNLVGLNHGWLVRDRVAYQNNVVEFRHEALRRASSRLRQSNLYPIARSTLGADRMRAMRGLLTRTPRLPSAQEALQTCDAAQLKQLQALKVHASNAVSEALLRQDLRCRLNWQSYWNERA